MAAAAAAERTSQLFHEPLLVPFRDLVVMSIDNSWARWIKNITL
jgi:hypothetical protein